MNTNTPCQDLLARRNCIRRQSGFTLLELMVVVAIIGILFSFASLSVNIGDDNSIEAEAKRFSALVKLASEEAIINTREMVLEVGKNQYQFLELGEQGFTPVPAEDGVFRPRELPEHIEIELELEDQKVDFSGFEEGDFPKIGIFSSGEMTPFAITFKREDGIAFGVDADFSGNIQFLGKIKEAVF